MVVIERVDAGKWALQGREDPGEGGKEREGGGRVRATATMMSVAVAMVVIAR